MTALGYGWIPLEGLERRGVQWRTDIEVGGILVDYGDRGSLEVKA